MSYEKLPADLRKVIDDNSGQIAASMAGTMWDLKAKAVADAVSQSGDQVVVLDPDAVARWRKATQPVIDAWRKDMKTHKVDADKLLANARELFATYASVPEPQPPAPPKPQVTEAKVEPPPQAKADNPASAPQPVAKVAPAPKVRVAAPPTRPAPPVSPATHWWQFWKSSPSTASASPITAPGQPTTHWWQFWKSAAKPAPAAASPSVTPPLHAAPATVPAPSTAPAAAAIAKPVPATSLPVPPKAFDIPL